MSEPKSHHSSRLLTMAVPIEEGAAGQAAPVDAGILARMDKIDQAPMLRYRLDRFRAELRKRDYAAAVLFDPLNLRYATRTRNMAVWTMHAPGRCVFVATDGPVILFEFTCLHVTDGSTSGRDPPKRVLDHFLAGPRIAEKAILWADKIDQSPAPVGRNNRRLAVDRCDLVERGARRSRHSIVRRAGSAGTSAPDQDA